MRTDSRRLWLHQGLPGGKVLPRRQTLHHRRGHERNSEAGDCPPTPRQEITDIPQSPARPSSYARTYCTFWLAARTGSGLKKRILPISLWSPARSNCVVTPGSTSTSTVLCFIRSSISSWSPPVGSLLAASATGQTGPSCPAG